MPLSPTRTDADWLGELSVTASPLTLRGVRSARQFFDRHMRGITQEAQRSFLKGIDLHHEVRETMLHTGAEVAAFRFPSESPIRLFYTKVGVASRTLGVKTDGREFRRFRVIRPLVALESRCSSIKLSWTDDPRHAAEGGGVQYIVPHADTGLQVIPGDWRRQPVDTLSTSEAGVAFLHRSEAQAGVSNRLHWPGGSSGVTIGAGYDMKERSAAKIAADLIQVGVAPPLAETASLGAQLTGQAAKAFAQTNKSLITLTAEQEMRLLMMILPWYEAIVKRNVSVPLYQHEFDALTSFVYNPGASFLPVANAINEGRLSDAAAIIRSRVLTGGVSSAGLVNRRANEINLLLHARYDH